MRYSILIVESDAARRQAWGEAILQAATIHGVAITVTAARSAAVAQFQAGHKQFHLLVAALSEGGVGLAGRLRGRSPHLRALLFHPSEASAEDLRDARWLGYTLASDPEDADALVAAVGRALGLPLADDPDSQGRPPATLRDVQMLLDVLRWQTKAQLILYTDYIGNTIAHRGDPANLDLGAITSLIAGSFVNSFELGRALRDPNTRYLNLVEGDYFDVYATNAGNHRLLALVFDKEFVIPKLGYVWLQLKRSANQLSQMRIVEGSVGDVISAELTASLNTEFDRLFGNDLLEVHDTPSAAPRRPA
jgi:hypothetical protein